RVLFRSQLGESSGHHLWRLAHGKDARSVETKHDRRSISTENTFTTDITEGPETEKFLRESAEEVAQSLRDKGFLARTVRLKVRTGSFRTMNRSRTLDAPTHDPGVLYNCGQELLREVQLQGEGIRLLGLGASNLVDADTPCQQELFHDPAKQIRDDQVTRLLDQSRHVPGIGTLQRGSLIDRPESTS
ncbi:MAG: hypothetical protein AAEJ04_01420, partial [Planctomycetota bacterium]